MTLYVYRGNKKKNKIDAKCEAQQAVLFIMYVISI